MTPKRLSEITKYFQEMRDSAQKRINRSPDKSCQKAEATGNYTSLSAVLSIIKEQ